MSGLKIGGYKDAEKSVDLDLSSEVQNTESSTEETAATEQIQDTSQEIQETGQFDQSEETEPTESTESTESTETQEETETEAAQQASETDSSSTEDTQASEQETESTESTESTTVEEEVEVSEELILKSLSEKLGREITSFDDLTETSNPLEEDEYLSRLVEWREKTGRPIEDWVKYQKDYNEVPDVEVAREFLQLEYPELTPEDIQLELDTKYISSEDDMDSDAALKNLELKKLVAKGRKELGKLVSDLGEPNTPKLSKEMQQDLQLAKQFKQLQADSVKSGEVYNQGITTQASEFKSIKMDLAEGVSLDFKLPEGSEKSLVGMVQDAPHWKNEDGSWNHQAIVRDAAIIANYEQMLKIAYEQGRNSGNDEIIQEAKNTTLGNRSSNGSALPNESKGVQIEGLDKFLGKNGMKIRKRK